MRIHTKYTPTLHTELVKLIRGGHLKAHAAAKVGITEQTLNKWLGFGAAGEAPYAQLAIDVDAAIADRAHELEALIVEAAKPRPRKTGKTPPEQIRGDWKAAAWLLERRYPELYGPRAAELGHPPRRRVHSPFTEGKPAEQPRRRLPHSPLMEDYDA